MERDVVIVGGGIHGVGCAQAAAAAGYSALVLEQSSLAAGSSSRSSKLIHGGLRYLESAQWRLVRESLHERRTLLRLAPELVRLETFYVPLYAQTRRRSWQLRTGLSLYALLAGFSAGTRFGTVPRAGWPELDGLRLQDLRSVFWYHDAQTDDAALTRAVMASARELGAELQMPARFLGATLGADRVTVRYLAADGRETECSARTLINAAGPWAPHVARAIMPQVAVPALELVQGSHLVIDTAWSRRFFYVESPRDGRAIFFMPWHGRLLVGTTEVRYRGDPGAVHPSAHELQYLHGVVRHYFPGLLSASHPVTEAFAGLRVLPAGGGHAFHRSRETLLLTDQPARPHLLSIYGGKLTTWRAVSARALAMLKATLPERRPRACTDQLPLRPC
jgi:glycerol-3-phosphate dehydrogenase